VGRRGGEGGGRTVWQKKQTLSVPQGYSSGHAGNGHIQLRELFQIGCHLQKGGVPGYVS